MMRTHRFGEGLHNLPVENGPPDPYDPWKSFKLLHAGITLKDQPDVEIDSTEVSPRTSCQIRWQTMNIPKSSTWQ
jgi:hypothetical protein